MRFVLVQETGIPFVNPGVTAWNRKWKWHYRKSPWNWPLGRSRFENAWRSVRADLERRARRLTHGDHAIAPEELLSRTALKAFLYICQFSERVRTLKGFCFWCSNHTFPDSARRHTREEKVIDPCRSGYRFHPCHGVQCPFTLTSLADGGRTGAVRRR